jgi:hypothetical protein
MATCPRCNKRAAKRYCPALSTKICAVCCAEARMIELACPESCPYLQSARMQAGARESELRAKELAAEGKHAPRVDERFMSAIYLIEAGIIAALRGTDGMAIKDLLDEEALAAVETTIKNFETEESGVIYEHRAASPRIQEVSRRIREGFDQLNDRAGGQERLRRGDIIKGLNYVRDSIRAHAARGRGLRAEVDSQHSRSYIRHITIFFPWPEAATKPLIIAP